VVITNHSHDNNGDLYIGSNLSASVDDVSLLTLIVLNAELTHNGCVKFMKVLFPPVLVTYLQPKATTLFMLCCGALVRERDSFTGLETAVN
jgi:hypothetical protein